jgi:hypothetical protein
MLRKPVRLVLPDGFEHGFRVDFNKIISTLRKSSELAFSNKPMTRRIRVLSPTARPNLLLETSANKAQ